MPFASLIKLSPFYKLQFARDKELNLTSNISYIVETCMCFNLLLLLVIFYPTHPMYILCVCLFVRE